MDLRTAIPIGHGASSRVYKIHHPKLEKDVALKVLQTSEPELVDRMLREARTQARLDHPNIARVLDLGHLEDGRPWIAMDLIEGGNLTEATAELTLEQKVILVQTVAQALHVAHSHGLVHRDVKPGNILVHRTETDWVPILVDFGLVREVSVSGPTLTGQALGTPGYMAPEQLSGSSRTIDRRADVYALGVVLYELLAGRLPFDGDSQIDLLVQQASGHIKPLRKVAPTVPRDLAGVVEACMARDPAQRYASAREFAEDLGRYLDGQRVTARFELLPRRLAREIASSARRSPRIATALMLAMLALLVVAGWAIADGIAARRSANLAQRLVLQSERTRAEVEISKLLPLHDLTNTLAASEERRDAVLAQLDRVRPAVRPGVLLALGRLELSLDRPEEAARLAASIEAENAGGGESAVLYSWALLRKYERAIVDALKISNADEREGAVTAVRNELAAPTRQAILRAQGATGVEPVLLEALLAYAEERNEDALHLAQQASDSDPGAFEALEVIGQVQRQRAFDLRWAGDLDGAALALAAAEEAYRRAATVARSDPRAHLLLCEAFNERLELSRDRGESIDDAARKGVEACSNALTADPQQPRASMLIARIQWRQAQARMARGEDPGELLKGVVEAGARGFAHDPSLREAFNLEALGWIEAGRWKARHLEDPSQELERGIEVLQAGLEHHPGYRTALNNVGYSLLSLAGWQQDSGVDAEVTLKRAAIAFEETIRADPTYVYAYNNLAVTWRSLGDLALERGEDASSVYRKALEATEQAIERNPSYAGAYNSRGQTLRAQALAIGLGCGEGVERLLERSRESFRKAAELRGDVWKYPGSEAKAWLDSAENAVLLGEDPESFLSGGREAIDRAAALWADPVQGVEERLQALRRQPRSEPVTCP